MKYSTTHVWLRLPDCRRVKGPLALAELTWPWQGQSSVSAAHPGVLRPLGYDVSLW